MFLDRDGVLNRDFGHVGSPRVLQLDARRTLRRPAPQRVGLLCVPRTNQAGVARGYYGEHDVQELHHWIQRALRAEGAHLDDIRYCPDHPDAIEPQYKKSSARRKPEPGIIFDLIQASAARSRT